MKTKTWRYWEFHRDNEECIIEIFDYNLREKSVTKSDWTFIVDELDQIIDRPLDFEIERYRRGVSLWEDLVKYVDESFVLPRGVEPDFEYTNRGSTEGMLWTAFIRDAVLLSGAYISETKILSAPIEGDSQFSATIYLRPNNDSPY